MPRTRRPRYASFLLTGAAIGFVASFALLQVYAPVRGGHDRTELSIFLTLFLAGTGALLAGLLAVVLEARGAAARRHGEGAEKATPSP